MALPPNENLQKLAVADARDFLSVADDTLEFLVTMCDLLRLPEHQSANEPSARPHIDFQWFVSSLPLLTYSQHCHLAPSQKFSARSQTAWMISAISMSCMGCGTSVRVYQN